MSDVIDGKVFAASIRERVKQRVAEIKEETSEVPGLAVVRVGNDPASEVYVRNKVKQTEEVGMHSVEVHLPEDTTEDVLLDHVKRLNEDHAIHGILVQLPLPRHLQAQEEHVLELIDPAKDVDGFHPVNVGKLMTGQRGLVPCTPLGCSMMIKDRLGEDLSGKRAVVIGRSNIVGKPMAQLLLAANATVTIVHSRTEGIEEICQQADILVAAVGKPKMVTRNWVKAGAVVIDVGINRIEVDGKPKLVGDVDFEDVSKVASAITPVPGGVGPMTIACLLNNTLEAFIGIKGLVE
jgi:methylenetetrahydrofolate dehydrogenase (NADP+)/methenyltetrahydrofolate cyclohydrolase